MLLGTPGMLRDLICQLCDDFDGLVVDVEYHLDGDFFRTMSAMGYHIGFRYQFLTACVR